MSLSPLKKDLKGYVEPNEIVIEDIHDEKIDSESDELDDLQPNFERMFLS